MILRGKVISGIGVAKIWVTKIKDIFDKNVGIELFPGTLNVKLNEGYEVIPNFVIAPKEYGGTQNVFVQNCNIKNDITGEIQKAFIVRAEKNAKKIGDHDTDIVEIVSDINFREKYNLKDDDFISIEIF